MHPSRMRARISMVWTLSLSARKFSCTIDSPGNLNGSTLACEKFYGRRAGQATRLRTKSVAPSRRCPATPMEAMCRRAKSLPVDVFRSLAAQGLTTRNLLVCETPKTGRRLATNVTKFESWGIDAPAGENNGDASKPFKRKKTVKRDKTNGTEQATPAKLKKLRRLVDAVCGIYTRVAQRLGVHRSYVSRVAKGERRSEPVEQALVEEYKRVNEH